ncbi:MBOAT family O-acyltransferase [Clostridium frigidicarnis]|uniref:MBOAT family O-acyltransferase n=1 Tax=Clostridium frigidicarnis TaxID=84698 RepID=UPI0031194469
MDTYKKKELNYNLIDYSLFITFFPHLVAGPIVSHAEIIPQVENQSNFNMENFIKGLTLFSIGLFKKVMVADYLGGKVNTIFGDLNSVTMPLAWVGALSYTMQIFLDFSAYSEMAMGIGLMFNIELPFNFLSPYKSSNIKEFWNRWHITLGRFLTNYIYIPLGGNRKGFLRTLINMFIVFLISGIWHGAGYTFIIWGVLHGFAIIIHRIWTKLGFKMSKILGCFLTFNFVNIVWIFFRSKDLESSFIMIGKLFDYSTMYNMGSLKLVGGLPYIIILLVVIILVFTLKNSKVILTSFNNYKYIGLLTGALLCVCLLSLDKVSQFIYFNF